MTSDFIAGPAFSVPFNILFSTVSLPINDISSLLVQTALDLSKFLASPMSRDVFDYNFLNIHNICLLLVSKECAGYMLSNDV